MITVDQIAAEMRRIAEAEPEFVYGQQAKSDTNDFAGTCSYIAAYPTAKYGRGCIVGQAMIALGVAQSVFEMMENGGSSQDAVSLIRDRKPEGVQPPQTDEEYVTLGWIRDVQIWQDALHTWGSAVARADAATVGVGKHLLEVT